MVDYIRSDSTALTNEGGAGGIGANQVFTWTSRLLQARLLGAYIFSTGNVNNGNEVDDGIGEITGYTNFGSTPYFENTIHGSVYLSATAGVLGLTCIGFSFAQGYSLYPGIGKFYIGVFLPDWWGPGLTTDYGMLVVEPWS